MFLSRGAASRWLVSVKRANNSAMSRASGDEENGSIIYFVKRMYVDIAKQGRTPHTLGPQRLIGRF